MLAARDRGGGTSEVDPVDRLSLVLRLDKGFTHRILKYLQHGYFLIVTIALILLHTNSAILDEFFVSLGVQLLL